MNVPSRILRCWLCLSVLVAVFACSPVSNTGFRDVSQPIGATTRFDREAFAGDWTVAAQFASNQQANVQIRVLPGSDELDISSVELPQITGVYRVGQPGELIPNASRAETLIVMWVDEGFRTAAIGTASGSFGAVLNRSDQLPQDRARAAREVLSFYGWDVGQLKGTVK